MAIYNNFDGSLKNEFSIGKSNKTFFKNSSGKWQYKDSSTGSAYQDLLVNLAPGPQSTPAITINAGNPPTLDMATLYVNLYSAPSWQGAINRYQVSASGLAISNDNDVNYLVADYNSGTPVVYITNNPSNINGSSKVLLANMFREGSEVHYIPVNWGLSTASRLNDRLINTYRFERSSGLTLSEISGRIISVSSGVVWYGVNAFSESAATSQSSNAMLYYMTGGNTWNKTAVSTYDNSHYNDTTTGLATLGNNKYVVNWIYRFIDGSSLPKIAIVLSPSEYSKMAEAAVASVPTIPTILSRQALLIGKIITVAGASSASQIDSAFTQNFSYAAMANHNNLTGIQGGQTDEYYHLTSAEYSSFSNLMQIPASSTQGDILYHNGSAWTRLAHGVAGQLLSTNGANHDPSWIDAPSSGASNHNDLLNIQGGGSNNNYHLTSTQYSNLPNQGTSTTSSPSFVAVTTDSITEKTSGAGVTITNLKVADSSVSPSSTTVGMFRYRKPEGEDKSYCDMVMQTGATTYEWVNIMISSW